MALQLAVLEAVLEELRQKVLVLAERDHAVPDVAGGKHLEVFAQPSRGAPVIGDGHDGGEIANETTGRGAGVVALPAFELRRPVLRRVLSSIRSPHVAF